MKRLCKYILATSLVFSSIIGVTGEKTITEAANNKTLKPTKYLGVPVNADTLLEQKIAVGMLNGRQEIDVTEFMESKNFTYLEDVAYKVSFQNPLVLGVKGLSYLPGTKRILIVDYYNKSADIKKKQKEIIGVINKVFPTIIKKGMTLTEKNKAIFDYLERIGVYDKPNASTSDADAHSAYGILVKGKGVCESYAESYKLLADLAGLPSIVVTGSHKGNNHAWNKVKITNQWVNVDVTNNFTNNNVKYSLFEANDIQAKQQKYIQDKYFWTDADIKKFVTTGKNYDYYVRNNLVISTPEEFTAMLVEFFNSSDLVMPIRFTKKLSLEELTNAMSEAYHQTHYEGYNNVRYALIDNYVTARKK